tara:strand:+ start:190 stop:480 length:291 start_codon:yes stop_codon:yes gene_type:complete
MKLNKMIQDIYVLNNDELNKVVEAVKLRRNQLHFTDAHNLKFNDRVSFQGRHGITETGTVEKVKIKYVLVRTDRGQRWNVPGSHLTLIKSKEAVNA